MSFAMTKALFHWGIHPWANYAVLALALCYFWYRREYPGLVSSILIPILGKKVIEGKIGKSVDLLAIFATVAGVSTSLGIGAMQINSGLYAIFGVPENKTVIFLIIVVVSIAFIISAISGIGNGIRILSNVNVILCCAIAGICLLVGPTIKIINTMIESTGVYLQNIIQNTLAVGAYENADWYGNWTIFYWGWWIAWAPFTAVFIARISKGRTIKEFCMGVVVVPTIVTVIWFSIFGVLGMNLGLDIATEAIQNTATALFVVLQEYPLSSVISVAVIVLLCTFFVTSADSATFVMGMLSSNGNLNPSNQMKVIWGIIESSMALSLILFTDNGLNMLQTISIVGALPFSLVMVGAMVALVKNLRKN